MQLKENSVITQKNKNLYAMQPNLRFKKFNDTWKKKSFKELVKINQGLQIPISDRLLEKEKDAHFYITNEFLKRNSKTTYYIKNASQSVTCSKSDILMTRTGNTGMVVTNVSGAFHNNFFKIKYPDYIDRDFLVYFLKLPKTQNEILRLAGTSTIPDLNHSDFYKIYFKFPSLEEQQKIASFLSAVDKRIDLLEQKKSKFQEYKKGVMHKIFSQKIRFKDADEIDFPKWKTTILGKVVEFSKGKNISKSDIAEEGISPCIRYGQLYTDYREVIENVISRTNLPKDNLVFSKKNDVIIPSSGETSIDIATASCVNIEGIALGGDITILRSQQNGQFLAYYLSHFKQNEIASMAQGNAVVHLYSKNLKNLKIEVPNIEEQTIIASFLNSIDKKIKLVENQIEGSNQYKKGLLQQIFV